MDKKTKSPLPLKISVSKFQVPHSDERREISIGCRITPREKRLMDIMMSDAKGKFPWVTESDFHYWCFRRGLGEASETLKSGRFTNLYKQTTMEDELLIQAADRRKLLNLLKNLKEEVDAHDALNAQDQVPPLLRKFEANLLSMERTYWTERVKKDFYREYGRRLRQGQISPRPSDAQDDQDEEE